MAASGGPFINLTLIVTDKGGGTLQQAPQSTVTSLLIEVLDINEPFTITSASTLDMEEHLVYSAVRVCRCY